MQTPPSAAAAIAAFGLALLVGCGSSPGAANAEADADTGGRGADVVDGAEVVDGADVEGTADAASETDTLTTLGFPLERTLACDYEQTQTLDLRTGVVRIVSPQAPRDDLTCLLARHVGVTAQGALCALVEPASELGGISLPSRCEDEEGIGWTNHQLCGVTMNPFSPACLNTAMVIRAASDGALYRVRVLEDFMDEARGNGVRFLYEPLTP